MCLAHISSEWENYKLKWFIISRFGEFHSDQSTSEDLVSTTQRAQFKTHFHKDARFEPLPKTKNKTKNEYSSPYNQQTCVGVRWASKWALFRARVLIALFSRAHKTNKWNNDSVGLEWLRLRCTLPHMIQTLHFSMRKWASNIQTLLIHR